MNEFLDERIRLVRQLIGRADPFTKTRLEKLAERYETERGSSSRAVREIQTQSIFPIHHWPKISER